MTASHNHKYNSYDVDSFRASAEHYVALESDDERQDYLLKQQEKADVTMRFAAGLMKWQGWQNFQKDERDRAARKLRKDA